VFIGDDLKNKMNGFRDEFCEMNFVKVIE